MVSMGVLGRALGLLGSWCAIALGLLTPVFLGPPWHWSWNVLSWAIMLAVILVFTVPGLLGYWAAGRIPRAPVKGGLLLWVAGVLSAGEFVVWANQRDDFPGIMVLAYAVAILSFLGGGLFALIGAASPPPAVPAVQPLRRRSPKGQGGTPEPSGPEPAQGTPEGP